VGHAGGGVRGGVEPGVELGDGAAGVQVATTQATDLLGFEELRGLARPGSRGRAPGGGIWGNARGCDCNVRLIKESESKEAKIRSKRDGIFIALQISFAPS